MLSEKTFVGGAKSYDVFISYRRDKRGVAGAHLVKAQLEKIGYRVFLDVEELRQGDFNKALLARIESIKHFVVILTPNSLERCYQKGDWLYREIKCAFKHKRNIVPIMFDDTDATPPSPPRETEAVEDKKRNRYVYRKLQKLYNLQACVCKSENLTRDLRRLPDYLPLNFLRNAERVCCSSYFSGVLAVICILTTIVLSVFYERQQKQLLTEKLAISVKYEIDAVAYLIYEAARLNHVVAYDNEELIRQEFQRLRNYCERQKENKVLAETTKKIGLARINKTVDEYIMKCNKIHQVLDEYLCNSENREPLSEVIKDMVEEYNDLQKLYNNNGVGGTVRLRLMSLNYVTTEVEQLKIAQLQKEYTRWKATKKNENDDAYRQQLFLSEDYSKEPLQEVELSFR